VVGGYRRVAELFAQCQRKPLARRSRSESRTFDVRGGDRRRKLRHSSLLSPRRSEDTLDKRRYLEYAFSIARNTLYRLYHGKCHFQSRTNQCYVSSDYKQIFFNIKTTFTLKFRRIHDVMIFITRRDEFVRDFDDFEDYDFGKL